MTQPQRAGQPDRPGVEPGAGRLQDVGGTHRVDGDVEAGRTAMLWLPADTVIGRRNRPLSGVV